MINYIIQAIRRFYLYLTIKGYYSARKSAKQYFINKNSTRNIQIGAFEPSENAVRYFIIKNNIEKSLHQNINKEDESLFKLGEIFLDAAGRGDADMLQTFIDGVFSVSWKNPRNGLTALHICAGYRASKALGILLESGSCNFLIRDKRGRLPSEMAYLYGEDVEMATLLGRRERQQADRKNIQLTRRPT